MLKAFVVNGVGRDVYRVEGSVMVVYDQHDNPFVVIHETSPGVTVVSTAKSPGFNQLLTALGLDRTVITHEVTVQPQAARQRPLF